LDFLFRDVFAFIFILRRLLDKLKEFGGDSLPIRETDILLGYDRIIQDYYELRKKEANINIDNLKEKSEKVNTQAESLALRERNLMQSERKLQDQMADKLVIKLPENQVIPLTNSFINGIPDRSKRFQRFSFYTSILAYEIAIEYEEQHKNKAEKTGELSSEKLIEFSKGLCSYATEYLFADDIRTHIRYLHNNKEYRGLVTSFDEDGHAHKITPIPLKENNLITRSATVGRSLIRNFNTDFDFATGNHRWNNYLTLAFTEHEFLSEEGHPLLSMGVSIDDNENYEGMLQFLNLIGSERIIEQSFLQLAKVINVREAIKFLSLQP